MEEKLGGIGGKVLYVIFTLILIMDLKQTIPVLYEELTELLKIQTTKIESYIQQFNSSITQMWVSKNE